MELVERRIRSKVPQLKTENLSISSHPAPSLIARDKSIHISAWNRSTASSFTFYPDKVNLDRWLIRKHQDKWVYGPDRTAEQVTHLYPIEYFRSKDSIRAEEEGVEMKDETEERLVAWEEVANRRELVEKWLAECILPFFDDRLIRGTYVAVDATSKPAPCL